jgi:Tfp pilus assembly protein PilE
MVELIVVVVVIAILAAVSLVSYLGVQDRADVASMVAGLENVAKILSTDQINNEVYPATLAAANNNQGVPAISGTTYTNYFPTSTGFCVTATRKSVSYRVTDKSAPRKGVCAGTVRDLTSIIKLSTWTLGAGGVTNYSANGDGNSRINDTNPWNATDMIWDVSNQDVASDADGGWYGGTFAIDKSKTYRYSVFIRRKTLGNGTSYAGLNAFPDTVLNRSDGAVNGNPYFVSRSWWGNVNDWYLVVGHVWPAGSGSGSANKESGVYTMGGDKVVTVSDYVWQATTTSALHRAYLYYSTDVTTNQQFYRPRVDIVDGTEPTLDELLKDAF